MNRRQFLGAGAAGSLSLAGLSRSASSAPPKKPNLLFLWTDEQRADTMAVYGNRKIKTPNLNKLASESYVFEKTYITQPVSTPSRCSVMTGLWPHTSGCVKNNIPLPLDTPCLNELLADPDYRTAYMGKWHLGDEIFAQHGFEEWVSMEDGYAKYYREGRDRNARSDYDHFLIQHGYEPDTKDGKFSRGFAARRPIEQCKPAFLANNAGDFLRRHRGEPFILYVNFLEPHMPFYGPLDDLHAPDYVDLPANFDDPLEENEPEAYRKKLAGYREKYGETEEDFRNLIARYWGLCSQVDMSVGQILGALEDLGLTENTIVVYTSDHGDMMGSHRLVTKGVMYEEASRVPWLMRIPWLGRTQTVIPQPVSHIDLVPTLLELFGSDAGEALPGQSLLPLMRGETVAEDHVFIEWNGSVPVRTVVSPDGWKLCLFREDHCQLFNLSEDPGETTNLFDSGKHDDVIARLTERIRSWQESI